MSAGGQGVRQHFAFNPEPITDPLASHKAALCTALLLKGVANQARESRPCGARGCWRTPLPLNVDTARSSSFAAPLCSAIHPAGTGCSGDTERGLYRAVRRGRASSLLDALFRSLTGRFSSPGDGLGSLPAPLRSSCMNGFGSSATGRLERGVTCFTYDGATRGGVTEGCFALAIFEMVPLRSGLEEGLFGTGNVDGIGEDLVSQFRTANSLFAIRRDATSAARLSLPLINLHSSPSLLPTLLRFPPHNLTPLGRAPHLSHDVSSSHSAGSQDIVSFDVEQCSFLQRTTMGLSRSIVGIQVHVPNRRASLSSCDEAR